MCIFGPVWTLNSEILAKALSTTKCNFLMSIYVQHSFMDKNLVFE